jgi:hypothetical protein
MNIREETEELLYHAAQLRLRLIEISSHLEQADEQQHPHHILIAQGVVMAFEESNLVSTIQKLPEVAGRLLPDLIGEVEYALFLGGVKNSCPHVTFHGNDDPPVYDEFRPEGSDPQYSWNHFNVGIGAAGEAIVVAFAVNIASAFLYDYVKRLREKNLQPQIDSLSAVAICEHELSKSHPSLKVAKGYAKPTGVDHAILEVTLIPGDGHTPVKFLIRPDGTICGRTASA